MLAKEALRLAAARAAAGEAQAQFALSDLLALGYHPGTGSEVFYWTAATAEQGYSPAQSNLCLNQFKPPGVK